MCFRWPSTLRSNAFHMVSLIILITFSLHDLPHFSFIFIFLSLFLIEIHHFATATLSPVLRQIELLVQLTLKWLSLTQKLETIRKSKVKKRRKLLLLMRRKESSQSKSTEKFDYYLGCLNRTEPGTGSSTLANSRSSVGKLSIRRRRKNHARSSLTVEWVDFCGNKTNLNIIH